MKGCRWISRFGFRGLAWDAYFPPPHHFLHRENFSRVYLPSGSHVKTFSTGNGVDETIGKTGNEAGYDPNNNHESNNQDDSLLSSGLRLPQRCKNLLVSNWRGQLSTLKVDSDKKDASSIHGSLVPYAFIDGKPIVWLPKEGKHELNLLFDDRGSLVVGHTDPLPLIEVFCKAKRMPPRVILLGDLVSVDSPENDYLRRRILKVAENTSSALEKVEPNLSLILEKSGNVLNDRVRVLSALADSPSTFSLYRLYAKTCNYVDVLDGRHSVNVADVISAAADPLAILMNGLVEGVNQNPQKRGALVIFCAAYLQIQVKDAYLFSADRWGFNILGLPGDPTEDINKNEDSSNQDVGNGDPNKQWREFRFAFSNEVPDPETFCLVLNEMETEVLDTMNEVEEELQDKLQDNKLIDDEIQDQPQQQKQQKQQKQQQQQEQQQLQQLQQSLHNEKR